jgi:hypothetical protein
MVAHYTYLATDLVSNKILGELPVNNASLDCQLNKAGSMSAGMRLSDKRIPDDELIARTVPGRTAFWTYRENAIVWGGIVLSREYQSGSKSLVLTGQTFECYPVRRYPRYVIGLKTQVLNLGQVAAVNYLWNQLQSITNGSIGVAPIDPAVLPANDAAVQLTINGYDLATSYDDLIQTIVTLKSGPDYTIDWFEDGSGNPQKQLVCATPIGNPIGLTDLTVDYPGPVVAYVYTENASVGNNQWWAVGDGDGAAAAVGSAGDPNALTSGYPLWEGVSTYSGVTVQSTIDAHAQSDLSALSLPLVTHQVNLEGTAFPVFGSYGMGDYVAVNVVDPRFPKGFTFYVRAIGWTINPPDEGQGTEQITLVFDEATGGGN